MGRDLLAVLVYGTQTSILIGLMAGIMGILVGVAVGFISGYEGGMTDTILVSTTDVFMVLPTWPLIVILSQYLKALSLPLFATLLAIFSWPETTRRVRSQVISLKERSFVRLAKLSGQGSLEIAFREIAPNMLPYIGACFASAVSGAVLAESGLSLLGLAPVGTVTLGLNLNYATAYGAMIKGMWWWLVPTILCLVGVFLGLQLINMGLDEIYNPRLRK
jgi:peptide/nickel transport system permease protein